MDTVSFASTQVYCFIRNTYLYSICKIITELLTFYLYKSTFFVCFYAFLPSETLLLQFHATNICCGIKLQACFLIQGSLIFISFDN